MKSYVTTFLVLLLPLVGICQNLTADQLLTNAIKYHDPQGKWEKFKGSFKVVQDTPGKPKRATEMKINLPKSKYSAVLKRGEVTTKIKLKGDNNCSVDVKDRRPDSEKDPNERKFDCERAKMYRDYYTYLYGLPMKLRDPGTNIDPTVERRKFMGKEYLVLRADYDRSVGTDVWFFYFDPETYAMEIYQFYKTDEDGNMKPNSGEYILLSGLETISGVRMPKERAWYYNKDDKHLGTDILSR